MLNFNHLYYFHAVATEGSIAAAAQRLGVSQPTISEQVRTLERTLSVRLFDRSPGAWQLTDAGRLAFEQTSVMFRAGERLIESVGKSAATIPRSLRVGISGAASRSTASDFLMPLFEIDNCLPSLRGGDSLDLLRELLAGELDLVLTESEPPEAAARGLEITQVARTYLVAVAPPTLVPEINWQNVALIHYRIPSAFRWEVESFLETNNLLPRIAGEADDPMFLVEAAIQGKHVVVVPRSVARDAIQAGRLKVLAEVEPAQARVLALYQDGKTAELARRAIELLIAHAAR